MDEGMDGEYAMTKFLNLIATEQIFLVFLLWLIVQNEGWSRLDLSKVQKFIHHAKLIKRYGAAAIIMAFDEVGQADNDRQ
jgi:5-methyltetrahydrofolate--homocysteine methyltransferase